MIVRNIAGMARKINGQIVRPYRTVEVSEDYKLDKYLEVVKKDTSKKKKEQVSESKSIEDMTKDELLDYTAIEGIEADYSMTKKEIKDKIKIER